MEMVANQFKNLIYEWVNFKHCRIEIEIFFNVAKNTLGLNKIYQYTIPSF